MSPIFSGKSEGLLYSLSRWTDLPAAKWRWFRERLNQGFMLGVDPRTALPKLWSLDPKDTLGLVFWTKNPTNLIEDARELEAYPWVAHITLTGWTEVEHGAPNIKWGLRRLGEAVDTFGPDHIVWRFSPVPVVPDVFSRFERIAREVQSMGLRRVYVAFLQENDRVVDPRPIEERQDLLRRMSDVGLDIFVCKDDLVLRGLEQTPRLRYGVCEDGSRFTTRFRDIETEGCGCALAVDPFSINEACSMGCEFCYAADLSLAEEKRDTTKKLKVVA